jgi:hypothetical protein
LPSHFHNASGFKAKIEPVDLSLVTHAAQGVIAEGLETAAVAEHRGELGGDKHLAAQGLAQGLDARDFVDRRADDCEVEAIDGADVAVEHLAADRRPSFSGRV